jgi:hypothetical protein
MILGKESSVVPLPFDLYRVSAGSLGSVADINKKQV